MAVGALVLAAWLNWKEDLVLTAGYAFPLMMATLGLQAAMQWADPTPKPLPKEPSQAFAGAGVVLICGLGLSAAAMAATDADSQMRYILPALGIIGTLVLTGAVYRFAARHEGEIGEARFRTTTQQDAGD